ncbi:MAG TPA: DUF2079 domain-containing protein, partial [Chloroflexi bacterium]|nr:DUF2079 domain-containing protein [Chloroflexota bacterium]
LLSPPLQAAAVADFHADPFVVAPFLFAFWYAAQRRWGWMWFWAIVVMSVKENMPTLAVMLGLYLVICHWSFVIRQRSVAGDQHSQFAIRNSQFAHGLGLIIVGTVWFLIATFGIVAPLAREYFGSAGPVYLSSRFSSNPVEWFHLLREPARLKYLLGLLATTGGLALLAPQYLLLGLPIFIANTFSNFPGQFSGEQHYSAPLVAALMIAAIYGGFKILDFGFTIGRNLSIVNPKSKILNLLILSAALLIALLYQYHYGWTPFSRRAEVYAVTAHAQMLPRFLTQIPRDVPISASGAVHPHLAHRAVAYTFPVTQEAKYILIDVTDVPGVHPNDVRSQIESLLTGGQWRLLDAADGFILLQKSPVSKPQILPNEFYDFARAPDQAGGQVGRWAGGLFSHPLTRSPAHLPTCPEYPLDITFGDKIRLLGFDLLDDPFHQQTALRLYWQALQADLPADLRLWPQFYNDDGQSLSNPLTQPSIETLWYPPSAWQSDEIIATQTLPANLGETFHLAVAVIHGENPAEFNRRLPLSSAVHPHEQNTWATVASFQRKKWELDALPPTLPLKSLAPLDIAFQGGLKLTGARITNYELRATSDERRMTNDEGQTPVLSAAKGTNIVLSWQTAAPLPLDYTIFIHFLDANGNAVAQIDAQPEWLFPLPTSRWEAGQTVLGNHTLSPPLPPGNYQIQVGLYDWQTLDRLPLQAGGDAVVIGEISVQ